MSNNNNNNTTSNTSHQRRASKRQSVVQKDLLTGKVQEALEHVVVTGTHIRQTCQKRRRWENLQHYRKNEEEEQNEEGTTGATSKKKKASDIYFVEDIRLYGSEYDGGPGTSRYNPSENGYPMKPWPIIIQNNQQKDIKDVHELDGEWNIEYGDSIPPIYFTSARLSQEVEDALDDDQHDGIMEGKNRPNKNLNWKSVPARIKSLRSTDISVPQQHVPRALLERCWTRAVQAAANGITFPLPTNEQEPQKPNETNEQRNPSQERVPIRERHSPRVEAKCRSLGIALAGNDATSCPRCTRDFSTFEDLALHYYGLQSDASDSCCQPLLRQSLLQIIDGILQQHVEFQTDQILHIVLSETAKNSTTATTSKSNEKLLDWTDVLSFLDETLSRHSITNPTPQQSFSGTSCHPLLETISTSDDASIPPLLWNPKLVEIIKNRLIDRYSR
ncbi:hypothetical protein IV203_016723 [Nitzschia inconspicua]|uniref:Uncharacterized protein n=1 Tax=Nitzschia inconspicua TaxID=303405 RepID=A0A9K3KRZ3_9STRA|nr:hypothetical protein IV203_016723 [Nitzschia inconspicua]